MADKRTLYQLLEVSPGASTELIKAAYEVRYAKLADAQTPEQIGERAMLREGFELLMDPVRRKHYDELLQAQRLRAMSSGGEQQARPRPANAGAAPEVVVWSPAQIMFGLAALLLVVVVGSYVYFDHSHKLAAQRLEAQKLAEEARKRDEEARRRDEMVNWTKDHVDADRQTREQRQRESEIERAQRQVLYQQQSEAQRLAAEERRKLDEQRRTEQQRQREEQESLRRSQQQLERDRRHLQELERNRAMRF